MTWIDSTSTATRLEGEVVDDFTKWWHHWLGTDKEDRPTWDDVARAAWQAGRGNAGRRERIGIAARLLAGMVSNHEESWTVEEAIPKALEIADALIAAVDRKETKNVG